jgi:hypothetical protein
MCKSSSCKNGLTFQLEIILKNRGGGWRSKKVYNVEDARDEALDIRVARNHWVMNHPKFGNVPFTDSERLSLFNKINDKINDHINGGNNIIGAVTND